MANEGKTSNTYSSAPRIRTAPPKARSGRRLTLLGRLFMRASVLLVSIPHLLSAKLTRKAPPEGRLSRALGEPRLFGRLLLLLDPTRRRGEHEGGAAVLVLALGRPGVSRPVTSGDVGVHKLGLVVVVVGDEKILGAARVVSVVVGGTRNGSRCSVPRVALGGGLVCPGARREKRRDGDRCQDADDDHYDQELDEGESSFFRLDLVELT